MKHLKLFFTLLALTLLPLTPTQAQLFGGTRSNFRTDATAWVIADATTGTILDSSNARKSLQIASITKIATAIVVLDWAAEKNTDLSQLATVPASTSVLSSPNDIGLKPGDQITLRDAIYAALMQSDNQAAETLAVHVGRKLGGGTTDTEATNYFTSQMNALARKLGMHGTRFLNAHGLDDLERKAPHSTAADVSILANYAISHGGFLFYTSQKERRITWRTSYGDENSALIRNTNNLVGTANIDGLKTGTTRKSGPCLVITSAKRPDTRETENGFQITPRRLTVVVLNSPRRFDTSTTLLNRGWSLLDEWAAAGRPARGWKTTR